jgi:SAM-dependent methyltransferase
MTTLRTSLAASVLFVLLWLAHGWAPPDAAGQTPAPTTTGQATEQRRAFWNKEFEEGKALLQKEAAPLLVSAVQGRTPGTALDLGMGEGRNTLYLAAHGWTATGVDLSDVAIAQAKRAAAARGVELRALQGDLDAFDMGTGQWDLVTSFYMHAWHRRSPTDVPRRIMDALRPGGLLVIEGFADPPNQFGFATETLASQFSGLRVLRNELVVDDAAWYATEKVPMVRFVAEKPR